MIPITKATSLPARHRSRMVLAAAALLLTAACGSPTAEGSGAGDVDPGRAEVPASQEAAAGPPQLSAATTALRETLVGSSPVRYDAAAVQGTTLDGEQIAAADLDGPVVYWFWAPWCTVCRAEAPTVADVAERYDGQVTFIGVASRGPQDDMAAFVAETGTEGIRHIADLDGTVWAQFGVFAQPAFVFVDREGAATGWLGGLGEPLLDEVAASLAG
jgi:thiol-disulfide isomerase/thioredoxin